MFITIAALNLATVSFLAFKAVVNSQHCLVPSV